MTFALISGGGNVLEWFDGEAAARAALASMVEEDPRTALYVKLGAFDQAGKPVTLKMPAKGNRGWWIERNVALSAVRFAPKRTIQTPPRIPVHP